MPGRISVGPFGLGADGPLLALALQTPVPSVPVVAAATFAVAYVRLPAYFFPCAAAAQQ